MTKLRIAQALGVIQGIIESDYDLCHSTSKENKVSLLRDNLSYLQDELVRNHTPAVEPSAVPQWLEPGPIAPSVQVLLGKVSDAWPSLSCTDLLEQAQLREMDINLNFCDNRWTLTVNANRNDETDFQKWVASDIYKFRWPLMSYILASINDD